MLKILYLTQILFISETSITMLAHVLFRNTMSNGVFKFANLFISIITFIILYKLLPRDTYGELIILQSIIMLFGAFDFGTGTALEKYIPNYISNNSETDYASNLFIVFFIRILLGLAIFIFFSFLGPIVLTDLVKLGPFDTSTWITLGIILGFFWPLQSLSPALRGHNLFHELNITSFINNFIGSIFIIIVATFSESLILLLLSRYIIMIWVFTKHINILKVNSPFNIFNFNIDLSKTRNFINFSFWLFLMRASSLIVNQFDKVVVSSFLGPASIPLYYAALRVMQIPVEINEVLKSAVIPVASEIKENKNDREFLNFLSSGIKQLNAIFAFLIFAVVLFSYEILFSIGGHDLVKYTSLIQISCLLILPVAGRGFFANALIGSGEVIKRQAIWAIISGISFIFLLWFLITNYDIEGSIITKPINLLFTHVLWLIMIARYTQLGSYKFLVLTIKGQWPFIVSSIAFLSLSKYFIEYSLILFSFKLAFLIIMFVILWKCIIDTRIKSYLYNML